MEEATDQGKDPLRLNHQLNSLESELQPPVARSAASTSGDSRAEESQSGSADSRSQWTTAGSGDTSTSDLTA